MMHEDIRARHRAEMDEDMARRRDLGAIPDPKEWAWQLPEPIVVALMSPNCIVRKSYCASDAVAAALRPYGLCDYATRQLSVFGCAVLKELTEDY